jgi:hypothetical protein
MGKTKKQLEQIVLKKRQYRSNQGRSPEKMENNYKVMFFSICGLILLLAYLAISIYIHE